VAAQLREAARDMARIAALRAQAEMRSADPVHRESNAPAARHAPQPGCQWRLASRVAAGATSGSAQMKGIGLMTGRASTGSPPRSRASGAHRALGGTGTAAGLAATVSMPSPGHSAAMAPTPPAAEGAADATAQWPIWDFLELGALPGAIPSARLHARQILREWELLPLTEAVEQVVSELVANSVAAGREMRHIQPVRLWLLSDRKEVLVMVWDADPRSPVLTETDVYAESGRGLFLVQAFSQRWGSYQTPHLRGKVVWALCGMPTYE
jgi:anti-sigma regulatory factor (Ser/Thr protein kinase)